MIIIGVGHCNLSKLMYSCSVTVAPSSGQSFKHSWRISVINLKFTAFCGTGKYKYCMQSSHYYHRIKQFWLNFLLKLGFPASPFQMKIHVTTSVVNNVFISKRATKRKTKKSSLLCKGIQTFIVSVQVKCTLICILKQNKVSVSSDRCGCYTESYKMIFNIISFQM